MRSRNVVEDPDADVEGEDPALVLELYDSFERRGGGSGGTSGISVYDEDTMFAIERCERIEGVGVALRVSAGEGEGEGVPR
jgi:hypothetical protein